jgi:hypothetical protein
LRRAKLSEDSTIAAARGPNFPSHPFSQFCYLQPPHAVASDYLEDAGGLSKGKTMVGGGFVQGVFIMIDKLTRSPLLAQSLTLLRSYASTRFEDLGCSTVDFRDQLTSIHIQQNISQAILHYPYVYLFPTFHAPLRT